MLVLYIGMLTMAHADAKYDEARGQLLYETHCNACHSTQIHWRDQKQVTDWESLVTQVRYWQFICGLSWNRDEIDDVAHHLDKNFYGYKNSAQGRRPQQLMHRR